MKKVKVCFLYVVISLSSTDPLDVCTWRNEILGIKYILRLSRDKTRGVTHFSPENLYIY